jgi:hypothetical protein
MRSLCFFCIVGLTLGMAFPAFADKKCYVDDLANKRCTIQTTILTSPPKYVCERWHIPKKEVPCNPSSNNPSPNNPPPNNPCDYGYDYENNPLQANICSGN